MTATLIDGKAFAEGLRGRIAGAVAGLKGQGVTPALAVVLVGEDPASQVYVRNKGRQTEEAGMRSIEHRLPASTRQEDLLALVQRLNADPEVDGILVQLPLPAGLDPQPVIEALDPSKDVDGLTPVNAGRLASGAPGLVPCTPLGSVMLIRSVRPDLAGLEAVVVGRSNLVGKPIAQLLLAENCTVTMAHSRTRDLPAVCRRADILVAAVGRPEMIRGDWVKPGGIVIDVGINRVPNPAAGEGKTRLVGDVAFTEAREDCRRDHPGARRRRTHDGGLPPPQHARRRLPPPRPPRARARPLKARGGRSHEDNPRELLRGFPPRPDDPARDAAHGDGGGCGALFGPLRHALCGAIVGRFRASDRLPQKPPRRLARVPCGVRQDGAGYLAQCRCESRLRGRALPQARLSGATLSPSPK
jgi:methylenetetrahydrofolate dehydrogenase (NADP+)/methenyltetrahydrofolate cyclohydrolase